MQDTMPQLRFVLRKRGRILWPRVAPIVESAFAPSDEAARDIVNTYRTRRALPEGAELPRTPEEAIRDLAWKIVASKYTGEDPLADEPGVRQIKPIEGLSPAAAAAALAWAASPDCPDDIYARDVAPVLRGLRVTAASV